MNVADQIVGFRFSSNELRNKALAIASYNCGLSNLMKYSFGDKDISSFSKNINKLSIDELYTMLTTQLRIAETRTYVAKVYKLNKQYQALLN